MNCCLRYEYEREAKKRTLAQNQSGEFRPCFGQTGQSIMIILSGLWKFLDFITVTTFSEKSTSSKPIQGVGWKRPVVGAGWLSTLLSIPPSTGSASSTTDGRSLPTLVKTSFFWNWTMIKKAFAIFVEVDVNLSWNKELTIHRLWNVFAKSCWWNHNYLVGVLVEALFCCRSAWP